MFGVNVTGGATGITLTVSVSDVAGLVQLVLVSVTKMVVVLAAVLLNPNCALVGLVPVVKTFVNPASLYQVYTLPPVGEVMTGALMVEPTQYVVGLNVTAGAAGTVLTVSVMLVTAPWQLLLLVSVTNTVVTLAATLLKPS